MRAETGNQKVEFSPRLLEIKINALAAADLIMSAGARLFFGNDGSVAMADEFYEISSLSLPEDFETFRHPPARTRISEPQFWDGYDRTTLIYDAVYIADDNILRICCSNPVNLAPILLRGTFSIDGTGARPERVRRQGAVLDAGFPGFCESEKFLASLSAFIF